MTFRNTCPRRWLLLVLAACLLVGLASGPAPAQEKVIKIGTIFPLTGPVAPAGQRCQAAVQTAVEIINNKHPDIQVPLAAQEGILGGHKIVLVHADSQGKPDVGKAEAERLINQEGVWALIGSYNSSVSGPASLVAERAKKIFMCGASSSAALTQRDMNFFFRTGPHGRNRVHRVRRGHEVGQQDPAERQPEDHRRHLRKQRVRQACRRRGQEGGRRRRLPGHGRCPLQPGRHQPQQRGADPQIQETRSAVRRLPRGRLLAVGAHHEADGLDAQDDPQLLLRLPGPGHHQAAGR